MITTVNKAKQLTKEEILLKNLLLEAPLTGMLKTLVDTMKYSNNPARARTVFQFFRDQATPCQLAPDAHEVVKKLIGAECMALLNRTKECS